jgi:hypothetical protein
MKHLFRLCAGVILTLAFAVPSFAGHIPCPITDPPPEGRTAATTESVITETVMTLMQSIMTVF